MNPNNYIKSRPCKTGRDDPHKPYHPTKGFRRISEQRLEHGWKHPLLRGMFKRAKLL